MKQYKILQLDRTKCTNYKDKLFAPLRWLKDEDINLNEYKIVYTGEIYGDNDLMICEKLYMKFNGIKPDDFYGHSLSMSDIIVIDNKNYYCDSFGFKEV